MSADEADEPAGSEPAPQTSRRAASSASRRSGNSPAGKKERKKVVGLAGIVDAIAAEEYDPEKDLVQLSVKAPRYLSRALKFQAIATAEKQQVILADALRDYLDDELVKRMHADETRKNA